jgi:hypothetical protein
MNGNQSLTLARVGGRNLVPNAASDRRIRLPTGRLIWERWGRAIAGPARHLSCPTA